eukprot:5058977-Heterocapsa_arctica.AAC.1
MGRGRDDPHKNATHPGIPLTQWDYTFLRSSHEEDSLVPVLVGYALSSGYGYGGATLGKGVAADKEIVRDA